MTRLTTGSLALLGALLVSACQLTPNFDASYSVEPARLRAEPLEGVLAVKRFEEARPPRLWSTTGKTFLVYVPLLPYVSLPYERVDESVKQISDGIDRRGRGMTLGADVQPAPEYEKYTYPASFPRAIAGDLAQSGLFEECRYVGEESTEGARYVLSGRVRESELRRTVTSFMLGMPGVLLWFLPVPMAKTTGGVAVDLSLTDQQTGETLWTRTLESDVSRYFTLYTSSAMVYGRSGAFSFNIEPPPSNAGVDRRSLFGWHFAALRKAMDEARPELAEALATHAASATP